MRHLNWLAEVRQTLVRGGLAAAAVLLAGSSAWAINGSQDTQVKGTSPGIEVSEIFTIGEEIGGYRPVGVLDGLGAYDLGNGTIRVLANHELNSGAGASYTLASGASLTGARVSYFDIDKTTRQLIGAGPAYDTIINAAGSTVTTAGDVAALGDGGGIARLCSAMFVQAGTFGFVDNVFLTGEEASGANGGLGGYEYALDTANNTLYAAPALGFAAWESVTPLNTGRDDKVAPLVGDDREGAPAYMYVGTKDLGMGAGFLERNGLAEGNLYAWVSDNGDLNPTTFRGTGSSRGGSWVEITDLSSLNAQDAEALADGAFEFSRPEDVHTDPNSDGTVAVFTSTGRQNWLGGADVWGTTYTFDVEFAFDGNGDLDLANAGATVNIIYDGDDAGNQDFGIRSPDNLTWADNGKILIQEDRAIGSSLFGASSGEEASIWSLDPVTGEARRIAQVDRLAMLPDTQTDGDPTDLGDWETSGIIDVSALFDEAPGTLFIADVQAHAIRDGSIAQFNLVEGGQLVFVSVPEPATGLVLLAGLAGVAAVMRRRK